MSPLQADAVAAATNIDTASSLMGPTFYNFSFLPVEIRLSIWTEFYLEPRLFTARLCRRSHFDVDDESHGFHRTWKLFHLDTHAYLADDDRHRWDNGYPGRHVDTQMHRYYKTIDSTIDRMSRSVARALRPNFWITPWTGPTSTSPATMMSPPQKMVWVRNAYDININWDVDLVWFLEDLAPGDDVTCGWFELIKNMALAFTPVGSWAVNGITNENVFFFSRIHRFRGVRTLHHIKLYGGDWGIAKDETYFQTRYLLRELGTRLPDLKNVVYRQYRLSAHKTSQQHDWAHFLDRRSAADSSWPHVYERLSGSKWADISKDELVGAKTLFRHILRAAYARIPQLEFFFTSA
ncbi:hypothetical protein CcaCcLH18_10991 [Colletotrichum camelliae]|nr:hypothetical protein CcaCcLH18_10991 [Colletotrichum camelliae]